MLWNPFIGCTIFSKFYLSLNSSSLNSSESNLLAIPTWMKSREAALSYYGHKLLDSLPEKYFKIQQFLKYI